MLSPLTYEEHARRAALRELRRAVKALNACESQWIDLSYPAHDVRRWMPDSEIPRYVVADRDRLRSDVSRHAATYAGEEPMAVAMFADSPMSKTNPYSIERVRVAMSLDWRLDKPKR